MQIKTLSEMLKGRLVNNDNLHLIAISNLKDNEKRLIRWWCDHYRQPRKPLDEYTIEELFIEQLECYYSKNPEKISEFLALQKEEMEEEWDGRFDEETEKKIQIWSRSKFDISRYQSKEPVSDEDADKIIASVGRNLPGSKIDYLPSGGDFEDHFD